MLSALRLVPRSDRSAMTGVLPTCCPCEFARGFTGHNAAVRFNVPGSTDASSIHDTADGGGGHITARTILPAMMPPTHPDLGRAKATGDEETIRAMIAHREE